MRAGDRTSVSPLAAAPFWHQCALGASGAGTASTPLGGGVGAKFTRGLCARQYQRGGARSAVDEKGFGLCAPPALAKPRFVHCRPRGAPLVLPGTEPPCKLGIRASRRRGVFRCLGRAKLAMVEMVTGNARDVAITVTKQAHAVLVFFWPSPMAAERDRALENLNNVRTETL